MSDEIKVNHEENRECKCLCHSKAFKKFLVVALGSFVGVFCALSLFAALHKPPMMVPHHFYGPHAGMMRGCPCRMMHHHHFDKGAMPKDGNFKPIPVGEAGRKTPFEAPRPQMR